MWFLGQRLCLADKEHISGCGTYERNGYIYSTLAGVVEVVKEERVFKTFCFEINIVMYEFERLETCAAFFSLFFCVTVIHDTSIQLQGAGHYPSSRGCSNS